MSGMVRTSVLFALIAVITTASLPVSALTPAEAQALADHVLQASGRADGGVACVSNAGDGQLAAALVQRSSMWVHALSPDDVSVIRALVEPTGEVGVRFYVENAALGSLPYAENFLDLLVCAGLTDATLAQLSVDRILTVLSPGGTAFVGRALAEGGGITESALTTWGGGRAGVTVTTDALGTWAVIVKPLQARTDTWTHTTHGPDNNPVSNDSLAVWPFLPQWRQKPTSCSRYGGFVTSNGRAYLAMTQNSRQYIRAYRIWNGRQVWHEEINARSPYGAESAPNGTSFMAAAPEGVYVMKRNTVELLDGETGVVSHTISFDADATRHVRWLALQNNIMFALVGDSADATGYNHYGDAITAYNLSTDAIAWSNDYSGSQIEARELGIANNRLYAYLRNQRIVALECASGAQAWEQAADTIITLLETNGNEDWSWCTYPSTGFLCSAYGLFICSPGDDNMVALSIDDGHLLWSTTKGWWGRMTPKMLMGNILVNPFVKDADKKEVDVLSGLTSNVYTSLNKGGGCGVRTASPDGFYGNADGQSSSISLSRSLAGRSLKTDCGIGAIISNGFELMASTGCQCSPFRGTIVSGPANGFTFNQTAVQSERLQPGPAHADLDAQVTVDDLDWWTHRGGATRTGSSTASLSTTGTRKCSYTPVPAYDTTFYGFMDQPDHQPTPPATAGDLVYWGGTDGVVRCWSSATGFAQWSFPTGGAIRATPTVTDGCVYVGSEDGYAYCLEAHTGRLVWRFRGAPVDRRINLYGHLASTWPINTGITVSNGVAYFAAGYRDNFGTHVYALDSRTGALVWQNNDAGALYDTDDRMGITAGGYGMVRGGTYWQKALRYGRNGMFSTTDGAIRPLATTPDLGAMGGPNCDGKEIGLLDDTHVIFGGNWWWMDRMDLGMSDRSRTFAVHALDAQGDVLYPMVYIPMNSTEAPAWDSQEMFMYVQGGHPNSRGWLEKWTMAGLTATVDSARTANDSETNVTCKWPDFASTTPTGLAQWASDRGDIRGIALGANAVAVTMVNFTTTNQNSSMSGWPWQIRYLDRTDGSELWQASLPSMPVRGGIAIDRSGNVIVSLHSGAVLCYGEGAVSVTERAMTVPAAQRADIAPTTQGWEAAVQLDDAPGAVPSEAHAHAAATPSQTPAHVNALVSAASAPEQPVEHEAACATSPVDYRITHADEFPDAVVEHDMGWYAPYPCAPVVAAVSTSGDAEATTDADLRTRWTSSNDRHGMLEFDLGQTRTISGVSLVWYARRHTTTELTVAVSSDGASYVTVDRGSLEGSGSQESYRAFLPETTRFVRITVAGEGPGNTVPSLYEVGVHPTADDEDRAAR